MQPSYPPPTESYPPPNARSRSLRSRIARLLTSPIVLLGGIMTCVLAMVIAISATGGVVAGRGERNVLATQTTVAEIDVQFQLGKDDMERGQYALAAQRFIWIVERDPGYPGAADALAEAQRLEDAGGSESEPTLVPSSAENTEELYAEAVDFYDQQDWANAITRLQQLQSVDRSFRQVEVEEMLYESLSTLGLAYIRGERLEEGLVLLDQAETMRPLDDQAAGEAYLATLYVTANTYWDLDWGIVIDNLLPIYEIAPNYRDTAQRLWEAELNNADRLAMLGAQCAAADQYQLALEMRDDSVVQDKYEQAADACANPTPIPTATPLGFLTPTPTVAGDIP
jgi:tetratricopeptide (TPR) repeat protein